jgi:Methyltransferase domain
MGRMGSETPAARLVRDDPRAPDEGFAELYASLPDATDLEPWLTWSRRAAPPILYLGVGAGRLAVPLAGAGVELVGVDAHPAMLARVRSRLPALELFQALVEELDLGRRFDLVMAPSNLLTTRARLEAAARHSSRRVGFELLNPHWLAAGAGGGDRLQVIRMEEQRAEIEIDYPGGWRQHADVPLVWPEAVEALLEKAGLQLEVIKGSGEEADLAESSSYLVLARQPRS